MLLDDFFHVARNVFLKLDSLLLFAERSDGVLDQCLSPDRLERIPVSWSVRPWKLELQLSSTIAVIRPHHFLCLKHR